MGGRGGRHVFGKNPLSSSMTAHSVWGYFTVEPLQCLRPGTNTEQFILGAASSS